MPDSDQPMIIENLFGPKSDLDALPWQPFRPGIEIVPIYGNPTTGPAAALIRYGPGAQLPAHHHTGHEHILVLRASQQDDRGSISSGTLVVNPPGTRHTVSSAQGCVALLIWEKPVVFETGEAGE